MKLLVLSICLVLLNISIVNCFSVNGELTRVKRSNETEGCTLKKVKESVKSFGSKVSGVATKGFEEFKNLFSKERKVGDYTLNNLDVRVREEDDYEEVGVKRTRRDLEDVAKDIIVFETTKSKQT
jgi:BMFP domain-containing protein YqiC